MICRSVVVFGLFIYLIIQMIKPLQLCIHILLLISVIQAETPKNAAEEISFAKGVPKVFDCFTYEGDELILRLKLTHMQNYVDYFIITQLQDLTARRPFAFNIITFSEFSHKIIYLPIRNMPFRSRALRPNEAKENQRMLQDACNEGLKIMAEAKDIVLLSHEYQIVEKTAVLAFRKGSLSWACCQLRFHYEYLNRRIVEDIQGTKRQLNYFYQGSRLLTVHELMSAFGNSSYDARRSSRCLHSLFYPIQKTGNILMKMAGWCFLPTKHVDLLNQAYSSYQNSYMYDSTLTEMTGDNYPDELVEEVMQSEVKSKYFVKLILSKKQKKYISTLTEKTEKKKDQYVKKPTYGPELPRTVFQCIPYNGEDHIMQLKLEVEKDFVDYYIVTEGYYSQIGHSKKLRFNHSRFGKYASKILYFPLYNFPLKLSADDKRNYSESGDRWYNEHHMRESMMSILKILARPQDVVIIADLDEILSKEGFMQFDPHTMNFAQAQIRFFMFYFNRRTVFTREESLQSPIYLFNGPKIIVYQRFIDEHFGSVISLRRGQGCSQFISALSRNVEFKCDGPLLRIAGWHFSSVLTDQELLRKARSISQTHSTQLVIQDMEAYRLLKNYSLDFGVKDYTIRQADLPIELLMDIAKHGNQSIYAPFLSKNASIDNFMYYFGYHKNMSHSTDNFKSFSQDLSTNRLLQNNKIQTTTSTTTRQDFFKIDFTSQKCWSSCLLQEGQAQQTAFYKQQITKQETFQDQRQVEFTNSVAPEQFLPNFMALLYGLFAGAVFAFLLMWCP